MDARLARDLAAAYTAHADRTGPRTLIGWSGAAVPGVDQQIIGTWMARNTWEGMGRADWLYANPDFTGYVAAHPERAADVGVPLVPHDSGQPLNDLLDEAASGARDGVYVALGASLARTGPATVHARLWWEMNMRPAPADQIDCGRFRAAWARAVPIIRAGFTIAARPGQRLRIVFCPISDGADWAAFWPGDDVVDVVALDAYGSVWSATAPTPTALLATLNGYLGRLAAFGAAHGKPVALAEWANCAPGTGTAATTRGLGDFPAYIDAVFDWAQTTRAAYLCYYNIPDGTGQTLAQTPKSLARLQSRAPAA